MGQASLLLLALPLLFAPQSALAQDSAPDQSDQQEHSHPRPPAPEQVELEAALSRAGDNRAELEAGLARLAGERRASLEFLIRHMPAGDLTSLSADFLVEHVVVAHEAWDAAPWSASMPYDVFLENVLPYASINERRDAWRRDFRERFGPLVAEAKTASHAAAILNNKIFPMVGVIYSTKRPKADQSPYESIEAGMAACPGLAVLLIDACRAVGVPARFVGIPSWSDDSGNHSWVEVWDDGWHVTGAAEPTGDELGKAWFLGRASKAKPDSQRYGIFAVSFKRTPQPFPMVWRPDSDQVFAVNVTERYTKQPQVVPEGYARVRLRVLDAADPGGRAERRAVEVQLHPEDGGERLSATTKDERFDANDHVELLLPIGTAYHASARHGDKLAALDFQVSEDEQLVTLELVESTHAGASIGEPMGGFDPASVAAPAGGQLDRKAAERLASELWQQHATALAPMRRAELEARSLTLAGKTMPFWYSVHGDAPEGGHSLYISMHGGGGTAARVNDGQWENQKRLYQIDEGVYVAPRAPTNTWNLWHEAHIDDLFDRLIEDLVLLEGVNPDRVFLLGYSAGGDGVYQLAPRMADRFAAAAMMAGHPNDAKPDGLRNLAFTLHMGANDGAYERNAVAARWKGLLADLQAADPGGYEHWVEIHVGKGHWMDRQDAAALPWMARFARDLRPERVVWVQDDRTHARFYWLAVDEPVRGARLVVERAGQTVRILEASGVDQLHIRLDDTMLDLDQPVRVEQGDEVLFEGLVPRTRATLERTLAERGDPRGMWSAEVLVQLGDGGE
ncbi:MAG: transglutaminase domain-containing protein [Planctomycetota bacterium]|nr:transglutaminase domain-containing protein [Planctomycetota bacterium]